MNQIDRSFKGRREGRQRESSGMGGVLQHKAILCRLRRIRSMPVAGRRGGRLDLTDHL